MRRSKRNRRPPSRSIDWDKFEQNSDRSNRADAQSENDSPSLSKAYKKAYLYACLMPVFGFVPAAMTFIGKRGDRQQREVSKVSLSLLVAWLLVYAGSGAIGANPEGVQVTSQLIQGSLSSLYFGISVWLMYRLAKGKQVVLPGQGQDEPDK
ncbi:hypothetical protein Pse7367_1129 [Thalassoporum mexicanum PCC 7367]|uniref:hypothetical protein n=1 Tax=Thalassoporum mexicanum TaxID=3457544 RepID=UPI00029FA990|nr:hypothetical protein [Pseudanabaena sp. PCC 7367]AFY69426.1 hypothetical protein Pse7367_1129 [Pseudanabaena sp. PCC 7367]